MGAFSPIGWSPSSKWTTDVITWLGDQVDGNSTKSAEICNWIGSRGTSWKLTENGRIPALMLGHVCYCPFSTSGLNQLTLGIWRTFRHRIVSTPPLHSFGYYCWSPKAGQVGRVIQGFNLRLTAWHGAMGLEWSGHRAAGWRGAFACRLDSPEYAAFCVPNLINKNSNKPSVVL